MNFQFYLERLYGSEEFEKFKREFPKATPVSGFFVIDLKGKDNKQHFDYFDPETKKAWSFQLENSCSKIELESFDSLNIPEKISMNYSFDFKNLIKLIQEEMDKKEVKNKIEKVLISLQKLGKEDSLICTVFISGMGMLKATVEIADWKIRDFEKKSFIEFLNIFKKKEDDSNEDRKE